ncbi:MAG: hypothetical protein CM15mP58_07540 [Burkholderiaceae bacterium]|nr:MAG: hypothetical protein CM15mP58_07540 [Burkholderiaceae bacterium]
MIIHFSCPIAIFAVKNLALVDYDVANSGVSDAVAEVSIWGYQHDLPFYIRAYLEIVEPIIFLNWLQLLHFFFFVTIYKYN